MSRLELRKEAMKKDLVEVLSSDAGKRVFGGIFNVCRLYMSVFDKDPGYTAYNAGFRAAGEVIANGIREIDQRLLGECEIAHREFEKRFAEIEQEDDDDADE